MKKFWKALALVGCALLLVVASVAGTYAILTSTASVSNTFTAGNVSIKMTETKVDVYGNELTDENAGVWDTDVGEELGNQYKLIPNHTYIKDPTIHVKAGSEECYLFVKVENGISAIEAGTTIAAQLTANGWKALANETNVYYKESPVAAGVSVPVFESFTITEDAIVSNYTTAKIDITAYAAQADGYTSAAAAWADSGFATQNNQGN